MFYFVDFVCLGSQGLPAHSLGPLARVQATYRSALQTRFSIPFVEPGLLWQDSVQPS